MTNNYNSMVSISEQQASRTLLCDLLSVYILEHPTTTGEMSYSIICLDNVYLLSTVSVINLAICFSKQSQNMQGTHVGFQLQMSKTGKCSTLYSHRSSSSIMFSKGRCFEEVRR